MSFEIHFLWFAFFFSLLLSFFSAEHFGSSNVYLRSFILFFPPFHLEQFSGEDVGKKLQDDSIEILILTFHLQKSLNGLFGLGFFIPGFIPAMTKQCFG